MKNKEFTTSQSINMVKDMLKDKTLKKSKDKLEVGDLFFGVYDAKNKEEVYNKRPFVMLLKQNKSHMLGIAFSWAPLPLRIILIKKILQVNAKNIKNNPKYENIPIIMITSRTADKHKNHALSLGVDGFLGKPYNENELIENIKKLTGDLT